MSDATVIVERRFRGPPNSGNGGYCCALAARGVAQPATAMLRALIPLDAPLTLTADGEGAALTDAAGALIAQARPADPADLPTPPLVPSLETARAAASGSPFAERSLHRGCFSCCIEREDALGVVVGQIEGEAAGVSAGVWAPSAAYADAAGHVAPEVVWAALDCPGSMVWFIGEDTRAGLLGAMACEIVRPVRAGEPTVVLAWPISQDGRKFFSGLALFDAGGALLARARQTWIQPSWRKPA